MEMRERKLLINLQYSFPARCWVRSEGIDNYAFWRQFIGILLGSPQSNEHHFEAEVEGQVEQESAEYDQCE